MVILAVAVTGVTGLQAFQYCMVISKNCPTAASGGTVITNEVVGAGNAVEGVVVEIVAPLKG